MSEQAEKVVMVDPNEVLPNPHQMRTKINPKQYAELKSIAEKNDHIDAITVTKLEDGRYQLVDGQQRLKVAIELGWEKIPATITNNENLISKTFAANYFRYKFNAIQAYDGLEAVKKEQNLKTQQELAGYLNVSEPTVSQMLSVKNLPKKIQKTIRESELIYPLRSVYRISAMKNEEMEEAFAKLTERLELKEKYEREGKPSKATAIANPDAAKMTTVVKRVVRTIEKTFMPRIDKIEEAIQSEKTDDKDKTAVREELTKLRDRINELISS